MTDHLAPIAARGEIVRDYQPVYLTQERARDVMRAACLLRETDQALADNLAFIADAWFTRATSEEPVR